MMRICKIEKTNLTYIGIIEMPSLFVGPTGQYINTTGPSGSEMKAEAPKKKRTVIKLGTPYVAAEYIAKETARKREKALAGLRKVESETKARNTKRAEEAKAPKKESIVEQVEGAIRSDKKPKFREREDINGTRLEMIASLPPSHSLYNADINWSQSGYEVHKSPYGISFNIIFTGKDREERMNKLEHKYPKAYSEYLDNYYEPESVKVIVTRMIEKLKALPEFSTGGYMFPTSAVDDIEEKLKKKRLYEEAEHIHKLIREIDTHEVGKKLTKTYLNKTYKPIIAYLNTIFNKIAAGEAKKMKTAGVGTVEEWLHKLVKVYGIEDGQTDDKGVDAWFENIQDKGDYSEYEEEAINSYGGHSSVAKQLYNNLLKKGYSKSSIISAFKDMAQDGYSMFEDLIN